MGGYIKCLLFCEVTSVNSCLFAVQKIVTVSGCVTNRPYLYKYTIDLLILYLVMTACMIYMHRSYLYVLRKTLTQLGIKPQDFKPLNPKSC